MLVVGPKWCGRAQTERSKKRCGSLVGLLRPRLFHVVERRTELIIMKVRKQGRTSQ